MSHYSFPAFKTYFDETASFFEGRRLRYKRALYLSVLAAIALIALLPLYAAPVMEQVNHLIGLAFTFFGIGWDKEHATSYDVAGFGIVIVFFSLWLALRPFFLYRGRNKKAGIVARHYSLKDHIYSTLLQHFGTFEFAPDGGTLMADIRKATIIPPYEMYLPEDYIKGVMNDFTVKAAETKIIQIHDRKRIAVFSGLVILIDISEVKVKLNGTFEGRTVLIADTQKELRDIVKKYASLKRTALPGETYEQHFEAFTSAEDEAKALLAKGFLDALLALQAKMLNLKEQVEHWDSKAAHMVLSLRNYRRPKIAQMIDAELEYEKKYGQDLDLAKSDIIALDKKSINHHVQAEFYDDKLLITVPCKHDLFEPNSLLEPALHLEDAEVMFAVMQTLQEVTGSIRKYLQSRG